MAGIMDAISHSSAHGGGTVNFAVGALSSGELKVEEIKWTPRMVGEGIRRLNFPGSWPAHLDPRELVIDLQGRIVGSSPQTYWTAREALLSSIVPPPDYDRDTFEHGTLTVDPPGLEQAYCLVNLLDYDIPMTSQIGRSSEYRISWVAHYGYWRAVVGDAVVYY